MTKIKGAFLALAVLGGSLAVWVFASLAYAYPEGFPNPVLIAVVGIAAVCLTSFLIFKIPDRS